jgi:hypothetical protein
VDPPAEAVELRPGRSLPLRLQRARLRAEHHVGPRACPGQYNRPIYFPTTVTDHGKQENDFSPTAELRADLNYQLTRAVSLRIGYTALFIDNVSRASSQVEYTLPRMGFRDGQAGKQEVFINGANFGFDVNF